MIRKWLLCSLPVFAFSLETKPWLGNLGEFEFAAGYTYSRFDRVQDASVQLRQPSNDHLLRSDLTLTPSEMWDVQVEVEFAVTPRQSWGYRSAAVQGRVQWLDDIAGDPVSWTTGLNVREVSSDSLHDISSPYHARVDVELCSAIGKEWSKAAYWVMRTWGNLAIGMGNRGSPWLQALGVWEKNWDNHHRAIISANGYFGFGSKQQVNVDHFDGWGKFQHRSVDLGVGYQYHFDLWGDITISYAYRVYAHTFPERVSFLTFAYKVPFSVL